MDAHTEPRAIDWRWTEEQLARNEEAARREKEEDDERKAGAFLAYEAWLSRG